MHIKDALEKHCRVSFNDDGDNSAKFSFRILGTLKAYGDDDSEFIIRAHDDERGHGWNFTSFKASHVRECFKQPSGIIEIVLK